MTSPTRLGAAIAHDDLHVVAEVAMMRLPLRAAEARRLERMQTLLEAQAELARVLAAHMHCGLVNFRGTHGTGDLAVETEALSAALDRYARLVKDVAAEYRRATMTAVPALDLLPVPAGVPQLMVG